jgi:rhamnulose-1-phosphate aldolase
VPSNAWEQSVADLASAGGQLTTLGACEGAAGNASLLTRNLAVPLARQGAVALPVPVPSLVGAWMVITASGRRLRDIAATPEGTLTALRIIDPARAELHAAPGMRPSSEWGSHLAVHERRAAETGELVDGQAVVHAQPHHLTFLSHLPACSSTEWLTDRLLGWEAEATIAFPEGIAHTPFMVPGSPALVAATADALSTHRLVVWAKHGVVARSTAGAVAAADLVEYAEAAARFEVRNLAMGEPAPRFTVAERTAINRAFL